jgi:shikimate kinase
MANDQLPSSQRANIVLIGYRGSGKTILGPKLAARLRLGFVDTDALIVGRAGKSIKEIFEREGEERFRDLESDAVTQVMGLADHVIALGGGALGRESNRQAIRAAQSRVVYLRCEPEELWRRIQADPQTAAMRPSLSHLAGSLEEVRHLLSRREPIYRQMKRHELDVTRLSPDEAVIQLAALLSVEI